MLLKPLREIGLRDLEELIGNVAEGLHVDFKQGPVGKGDGDRKEFVADVTAFANASGGDIVFGIVEGADAVASQVLGIPVADLDAEERRLAEIIRNGTEPRLTDFEFKWIDNPPNGHVLILRVGRSWRAPHRVTLAGHDRFYTRNTRGKHPMNTDELRTAFTAGQALEDRIAHFQRGRITLIEDREGPVDMGGGPYLVLHAVPLVSFADPLAVGFRYGEVLPSPLGGGGYNQTHTLEGPLTYRAPQGEAASAYTLHFRNGILEGVSECASRTTPNTIPLTAVEDRIATAVSDYLKYWNEKSVGPPYYLFVSILFAEGFSAITGSMWSDGDRVRLKRRHLLLPSQVLTQAAGTPVTTLLRPTFDLLWNGFGYAGSINFDERGRYRVQR
jgi:hypothetical protein